MGPYSCGSHGGRTARAARALRALYTLLAAILWIASVVPFEVSAQEPPWDIEAIQRRLVELGYETGEVDGLLGAKTRAALRAFQADRGLPENGLPDGPTQDALFSPEPQESAAAPPPSDDPPPLEAVPLEPVSVAPLATLETPNPHEDLTVDWPPVEAPDTSALDESEPAESLALSPAAATAAGTPAIESRKKWITWSAMGLGGFGLLLLLAALRRRTRRREPAAAAPPVAGRVFGVEVPESLRVSRPGERGSGGAG